MAKAATGKWLVVLVLAARGSGQGGGGRVSRWYRYRRRVVAGIGTTVMGINGPIRVQYTCIHLLLARPVGIVIAQARR